MVLGDHVDLHQRTVGDKARPLLCAEHMPRDVGCVASMLGSDLRAGPGFQESDADCAELNEEEDQATDGAIVPRIQEPVHDPRESEK